jgi:hypothetical protein
MTLLFLGCSSEVNVRSDSTSQRGIGKDTTLINKGRGAKQAQVSAAQAKQYDRQHSEGDKEMDYQQRMDGIMEEIQKNQRHRNIGSLQNLLDIETNTLDSKHE